MRACLGHFAFGLAMVAGIAAAQAQTLITRDVTGEPVAVVTQPPMVITQPAGTIITRPVETIVTRPAPTILTQPVGTFVVQPAGTYVTQPVTTFVRPATVVAEPAEPAVVERVPVAVPRRVVTERRVTTRRTVAARQPTVRRAARTAPIRTAKRFDRIPVLAATEQPSSYPRGTVYRSIVREAAPVTRQVLTAQPVVVPPVVAQPYGYAPVAAVPVFYRVGSILPAGVPLYAIPQSVAIRVPALRSYSYAYVNDRVLLVDPATNIVVADVTE